MAEHRPDCGSRWCPDCSRRRWGIRPETAYTLPHPPHPWVPEARQNKTVMALELLLPRPPGAWERAGHCLLPAPKVGAPGKTESVAGNSQQNWWLCPQAGRLFRDRLVLLGDTSHSRCSGLNCVSLRDAEVLTPGLENVTLFGNKVFADLSVKMRWTLIQYGCNHMKRKNLDTETDSYEGAYTVWTWEKRWGDVCTSQGAPVIVNKPEEAGREAWDTFSITALKINPSWTSLVGQWLRVWLPMQGTGVLSLVEEDSTCLGTTKPVCHNPWCPCPQEPVFCNKRSYHMRSHALQLESISHSPQLKKSPCSNEDSAQ